MPGYTVIDNDEVLDNEDLKPMEKLTLIMLIKFNNQLKGYAYPSLEVLKNLLGYSHIKYVIKIINSLITKGYIKKETVKQKNHYYILKGSVQKVHNVQKVYNVQNVPNVQNIPKDRAQNIPKGRVQNVHTKSINKSINKNTIYISLSFIDGIIDKVKITKEQYDKLLTNFSKEIAHKNIIDLDNYITNGKGEKYKEHYRVLNTWCSKDNNINSYSKEGQVSNRWAEMKQFN